MARTRSSRGKPGTRLSAAGRAKDLAGPFVNPPVVHASTVLFESAAEMLSGETRYVYGRRGTPTLEALETAITDLEGAAGTVLCPSGLNAIVTAILAYASAGDHILIPDSVYGPTRMLAADILGRFEIDVTYYDPTIGAGIGSLITPATSVVYVESPGSNTMEMQDIPAIASAAHNHGAVVIADNTWATPLYCLPLSLGADVAILAATKYVGGHADLMLGTVSANERHWPTLKKYHGASGLCAGPDDVFLALRGLRTMEVRLQRHGGSALAIAEWLRERPEIARVLYPALPSDPGHELWRRDMSGSSGLLSFVFKGGGTAAASPFLDALRLFGLGYSWGGFESLAVIGSHRLARSASPVELEGPLIRLHVGLEDPEDLIADLENALGHFRAG